MKAATYFLHISARQTPAGYFQDALDHCIDGHTRCIQQERICAWDKRRNRAVHIAQITLRYLQRKGGKGSSNPLFFQLLMASGGALRRTRREENLNLRLGEYHGAHIAAVGHETRGYGKQPLALQESRADYRQGSNLRGVISRPLGPNGAG